MAPRSSITSAQLEKEAELKLQMYKSAKQRQLILNIFGYSGLCLIAFLLVAMVGGEAFSPVLRAFGLEGVYNERQGVYADCSKSVNRNNPFCTGETPRSEQEWSNLSSGAMRSVPFSLSN